MRKNKKKSSCPSIKTFLNNVLDASLVKLTEHLEHFLETKEPESLHRYRVVLRTTRSVFKEFQDFLEKQRGLVLDNELKMLQKKTNNLRDIDVFVENLESYKTMLDDVSCHEEFMNIEKQLHHEKELCMKDFEEYTNFFDEKHLATLDRIKSDELLYVPSANEEMSKYFERILKKRVKKIMKISKKLTITSLNEDFHTLRIHYKILRYTADAFKLKRFSNSFKAIQTLLGIVEDKCMQIERIGHYRTKDSRCFEKIVELLENDLHVNKVLCIKKSNEKAMDNITKNFQKIFTCKETK